MQDKFYKDLFTCIGIHVTDASTFYNLSLVSKACFRAMKQLSDQKKLEFTNNVVTFTRENGNIVYYRYNYFIKSKFGEYIEYDTNNLIVESGKYMGTKRLRMKKDLVLENYPNRNLRHQGMYDIVEISRDGTDLYNYVAWVKLAGRKDGDWIKRVTDNVNNKYQYKGHFYKRGRLKNEYYCRLIVCDKCKKLYTTRYYHYCK